MTIREALDWAKKELKENNVEGPEVSAEFLLRQILNVDKTYLFSHPEKGLNPFEARKYKKWVARRAKHEPVWYITGKIEFFGQDFFVNENVLIPRPETELMIERVLKGFSSLQPVRPLAEGTKQSSFGANYQLPATNYSILDVGTGSGAIILSLANELNAKRKTQNTKNANYQLPTTNYLFHASDISPEALKVAKKNAKNLLSQRHSREGGNPVLFKQGDLFGPWIGQKFDLIVTNLPYVPHEKMDTLAYDLIHYEPRTALDGGVKGLEIYKRFFEEAPTFLTENGMIFCEIGTKQGREIEKMAKKAFPGAKVEVISDYGSHDRIVIVNNTKKAE